MARQLRIVYPGAYYHVTSRGNEQKAIFRTQKDREKFQDYLASATQRYGAVIHVYCLMTNHYHLLLETPEGNLSQIMRHINGAYTTYFNVKRKRAGHLLQGRFKALLVEADAYAVELSRYIHLNPVRAGMVEKPGDYPWSSYRGYIDQGSAADWLKTDLILGYFSKKEAGSGINYRAYVEELIDDPYDSPLKKARAEAVLSTTGFFETVRKQYLGEKGPQREVPALRQLSSRPSMEEILKAVDATFGSNKKLARQASMFLCHRYSGQKVREIGDLFGVGLSAVTEASRHFPRRMENDEELARAVEKVMKMLKI